MGCQFCKQSIPHPSPQESDWTDEDWTGGHTKTQKPVGGTNPLSDWDLYSSQYNPDSKSEVNKINTDKLSLDYDKPQEELIHRRGWNLRQVTNKRRKNMNSNRKSMWDTSAMRRAIQIQTIQASAIKTNKDIFQSVHLYNSSVVKC